MNTEQISRRANYVLNVSPLHLIAPSKHNPELIECLNSFLPKISTKTQNALSKHDIIPFPLFVYKNIKPFIELLPHDYKLDNGPAQYYLEMVSFRKTIDIIKPRDISISLFSLHTDVHENTHALATKEGLRLLRAIAYGDKECLEAFPPIK